MKMILQVLRHTVFLLAVFWTVQAFPFSSKAAQPRACGFASCNAIKPGMTNVHLVPHTHDDVGWLKTVDQYFYGSRNDIQVAGVQYIIDSVITELLKDPTRKFIYVETSFFWQWWVEQDDTMRAVVKGLVNSGQLEFISGGWSMNDEAATHYQSTVDQFTWGLRKLNDTFGDCGRPRVGWQIDPFGHARETASILAQLGFDGLFFGRLDYQDKNNRELTNTMELLWQASANLGDASALFTSVLYYFYMAPPNFCFDIECNDEPIIDNELSPEYNVDSRINEFINRINEQAAYFNSENIIFTMGGDFNYQQADTWYKNIDKLIKYINAKQAEGSNINLLYSTPSCYLKAVNDAGLTWTTKQDDFFPYSSDPHAFWTGYFTSRPTSKYYERKGNNFLQVCKQLHVLAGELEDDWTDIASLREIMGVMQHHDAITGTEKQHVADDYALRLSEAFDDCQATVESDLNKLMAVSGSSPVVPMKSCMLSNISQCDVSETSSTFVVTVYNPTAHAASQFVRLPVSENVPYVVTNPTGATEVTQLLPIPTPVQSIPGRTSSATFELVFRASDLPPLGFKSYHVTRTAGTAAPPHPRVGDDKYTIGNERLRADLDPETGLLCSLRVGDRNVDVSQDFLYYVPAVGNNEIFENRSSGAYIFRPTSDAPVPIGVPTITTFTGPIVDEIHQTFDSWVSQVIRTYHGEEYLELEWLVGPIPVSGGIMNQVGKEVITRFSKTGWATNGMFYTDSNGREMLQRQRNFRPTWTVALQEPVAGNYYPITTAIAIDNPADDSQLIVLNDRAQGGSSINDGEIELMVHRRLTHDDAFGVNEALDEQAFGEPLVARGRNLVVLGSRTTSPTAIALQRKLTLHQMVTAPWVLLSPTTLTPQQWQAQYKTEWTGLQAALADNVNLLTVEPWRDDEILLRLEHIYETTDDSVLSQPASVVLEDIFSELTISSPHETTLGANQWIEDSGRLEWIAQGVGSQQNPRRNDQKHQSSRLTVDLNPMEIRTFVVKKGP